MTLDLSVQAFLEDYYPLGPILSFDFSVEVLDPCTAALLSGDFNIEKLEAQIGEPKYVFQFDALSDTISDAY